MPSAPMIPFFRRPRLAVFFLFRIPRDAEGCAGGSPWQVSPKYRVKLLGTLNSLVILLKKGLLGSLKKRSMYFRPASRKDAQGEATNCSLFGNP